MAEHQEPRSNDDSISPVTRAASAAAIITAGFNFPNLWKNLNRYYPAGLTQSLASHALKRQMTSAELTFVLGKAAVEMHKDPAIIGGIARDALERKKVHDVAQRHDVLENQKLKEVIDAERADRNSLRDFHQTVSKQSIEDRVQYLEKEISSKVGNKGFGFASVPQLKKNVILNYWRQMTDAPFRRLFPDLATFSLMESSNIPLELYDAAFNTLMSRGGQNAKELGSSFLTMATDRHRAGILASTYAGNPIKLGSLAHTIISEQRKVIKFNILDPNFVTEKKTGGLKPDSIFFGKHNPVNDVMSSVKEHFSVISNKKIFGASAVNIRNLVEGMYKEIGMLTPEARERKRFGVRVDPNSNALIVFAQFDDPLGGPMKERTVRIALPNDRGLVNFSKTNRVILTNGVTQHGMAVRPVSSFERTSYELSKFARALVHGTYTEPRDGENLSLQASVNRLYEYDRPIGNPLTDYSHSKVMRSTNPFMREKGRMRMNRISGLTQHNVLTASQKLGQDILMYDQEFIAGREGVQIVAKNPHYASPYQITYRRMTSTGKSVQGGTIYIKTDRNQVAIDAWKRGDRNNLEFIRFKESLEAIGKGSEQDMANIINEIESRGVSASQAYDTVFNKVGRGCLVADYGGQGASDRAIIQFQTGIDYVGKARSIDVLQMLKAASSTKRGWSMREQFTQYVTSSSDADFIKLESQMLGYADTIAHRAMIDHYRNSVRVNPKNKRDAIIKAALLHGHDASVDTAMQVVLLNKIMSNKTLIGAAGSGIDLLTRLQQNPTISFREKIAMMNNQMLAAHFYGDTSAPELNNIMPTSRSDRQILTGGSPGVGANSIDLFEMANSGLKQIHQKFYGIRLFNPDKRGKFLSPFVSAFRKQIDHMGANAVADNIAINAEPVMSNVLLVPQGYGDFYDGSIIAEKSAISRMVGERDMGAKKILLGKGPGEIKDSKVADFLMKMSQHYKESQHLDIFKGDYLGTTDFNERIAEYISEQKIGIAKDLEAGLIDAGGSDERYSIKQGNVIARTKMSPYKMTHGAGRISALSFLRNNQGELEMLVNVAQLMGLEKTWVGGSKALVQTPVEQLPFKRDWQIANQVTKDALRPIIAAPYTMFKRGEMGTAKKVQVMRIYTQLMAGGQRQKATNFLQQISGKTVSDDGRIHYDFGSVQQNIDALNLISEDKLYRGMIDSGLTWDRHDIKLAAEHYKINYTTELDTANEFDRVVTDMWNKAGNGKIAKPLGGNYSSVLSTMMDNNELKTLRSIMNPFFHRLENKIVDPLKTHTARYFDPTRDDDGNVVMSIRTAEVLETIATQHTQVPGTRLSRLRGGSYLGGTMDAMSAVWEGSFTQGLLNRTVGSYKHRTRVASLRYLSVMQGTEAVKGKKISASGLDIILRRTLANDQIIKDVKDNVLDLSRVDRNIYNDYMKAGWEKSTSFQYDIDAEALEQKIKVTPNLKSSEIKQMREEIIELKRRAGEIRLKPMRDHSISPTADSIQKQAGTLWEYIDSNSRTREFSDHNVMEMDGQRIAPHDLLLFQMNGVSNVGNKKFWSSVMDNVQKVRESFGKDLSPRVAKRRAETSAFLKALEKFVEVPGSNLIALPTPQHVADIANLTVKGLSEGGYGSEVVTKSYTGLLTAMNEANNAQGGYEYHQRRVQDSLFQFTSLYTRALLGKKIGNGIGIMYGGSQYQMLGIRTQVQSPYAAILSVEEQLRIHKKDKNAFIAGKGELDIDQQILIAEKMKTGNYGWLDKESFHKMMVGDVGVRDFVKKKYGEDTLKKIMSGEMPIPFVSLRNPLETGTQMLFPVETYIFDPKNRLFKNMPKGFVPSLKFLLKGKADTDGDEAGIAMLNMSNMDSFNKVLAETRLMNSRENEMIAAFHEELMKTGNSAKAADRVKKRFVGTNLQGFKVNESEFSEAISVATQFAEDMGHLMRKTVNTTPGTLKDSYSLVKQTTDERLRIGKATVMDATQQALKKWSSNIALGPHIQEMYIRAAVQNIGKEGIGIVASYASRTQIRLKAANDFIGRLGNATEVSEELTSHLKTLGLFSEVEARDPLKAVGKLKMIAETYHEHSKQAYAQINKILRRPEQALISTKWQTDLKAGEMMFGLIENATEIAQKDFSYLRDYWGLNFKESELSALREGQALHNALYKNNLLYRTEIDEKEAQVSSGGVDVSHLERMSSQKFSLTHWGKLTPQQIQYLETAAQDKLTSQFSEKTAMAWRDSVKQVLYNKTPKSLLGLGIGLSLMTLGNPNQMTGGFSDFGIDLGHRPGFISESNVGLESLSPEPGQDIFQKKWAYVLKNDPILKDNMDELSTKSYKNLLGNGKAYAQFNPTKKYKRNYIDHRKSYNKLYETNDMRRAGMSS